MPSVIQTTNAIPASAASIIASAANAGGTKMILTSAPVFFTASATVLKTGLSRCVCPPFPGVTRQRPLYRIQSFALHGKFLRSPVKPWTIIFEFLLTKTDIIALEILWRENTIKPGIVE